MSDRLQSWTDARARTAVVEFVERVTTEGSDDYVAPAERIAVIDNDGTLWCEKPMPIDSNGDVPVLRYAGGKHRPARRLLVLHDDHEREFAYTAGAEGALKTADEQDSTVVSMKNDWATVFAGA